MFDKACGIYGRSNVFLNGAKRSPEGCLKLKGFF